MDAPAIFFILLRFSIHVISFHGYNNFIVCSGHARSKISAAGAKHRVDTNPKKNELKQFRDNRMKAG